MFSIPSLQLVLCLNLSYVFLVLWDHDQWVHSELENNVPLKPVLGKWEGGEHDYTSAHEQTQFNLSIICY